MAISHTVMQLLIALVCGLIGSLLLIDRLQVADALSTGAPSLSCFSMRPVHGLNRAKPASASQFFVTQSSLSYSPGRPSNITVEIATHSSERFFRGFLVQAYDPSSGAQIGSFLANSDARSIDSCASATHRNNQNKRKVSLIWLPAASSPPSNSAPQTSGGGGGTTDWLAGLRSSPMMSSLSGGAGDRRKRQHVDTKQVRFRATIVVTYQEFYTGFESSELSFEKFDFSPATLGAPSSLVAGGNATTTS